MQMKVAPFAGAWIEMPILICSIPVFAVAPFAGAWIEILCFTSFPFTVFVAPFAGAWIEILIVNAIITASLSRSLRGSVD